MTGRKRWMVAAIVLAAVGLLISGAALASVGFDFSRLSAESDVTNTYEVSGDFQNITVQGDTEKIILRPSEDGRCRVVCHEDEKAPHTVKAEGNTLTVEKNGSRGWQFIDFGFWTDEPAVTVYLPGQTYKALTVEGDTGDVEIPADFAFDSIHVRLSTGDIVCRASAAGEATVKTSTGDIDLFDMQAGTLLLSAGTGGVHAVDVACKNDLEIRASTGRTALERVTCGNLVSTGSTGSLVMTDVIATGSFNLQRSTGSIRFDGCDAESIRAKTDTGSVKGTLLSAKTFYAASDTGRVEVPKTTVGGRCEITTDTGSIKIEIKDANR